MIRACDAAGDVGQWQQYLTPGSLTFFFAAAPTAAAEAPGPSFRLAAPSAGAALVSADASCAGSAFAAYFFLASVQAQSSCEAGSTGAPGRHDRQHAVQRSASCCASWIHDCVLLPSSAPTSGVGGCRLRSPPRTC